MIPIRRNADPWSRLASGPEPPFRCVPGRTALVVVDMQYSSADRDHLLGAAGPDSLTADLTYRVTRTEGIVPRIQGLQRACRASGVEVMFVRIAGLTLDGRDHPRQPRPHFMSREAAILAEIAPVGDEIVLNKTTSSPFSSTHIDYLLRSMGIEQLLICGVATSGCVELTARDANDRGYRVVVIGDCCAGNSEESERSALEAMNRRRMRVKTSDEVIRQIEAGAASRDPELGRRAGADQTVM